MQTTYISNTVEETTQLGHRIGGSLKGGETLELISDLGGGKTTFVSGLAKGFGSSDPVSSPSFTINNVYQRADKKRLFHFDFYRLTEPGVVASELAEVEGEADIVVVVEWGEIVHDVLPGNRIKVTITAVSETSRQITFDYAESFAYLFSSDEKKAVY